MHYPDLGSASDLLCREGISFQPIRSTTKIWVVTRHQYGISALVTQTSFYEGSSGDLAKHRLFSQATLSCTSVETETSRYEFISCACAEQERALIGSLLRGLSAHISRVEKWKYIRASTRCDWLPSIWLSAHIVRAVKSFEIDGEKTASYDSNYFW